MEYKTANELKSKEYIIDPETEEIFQIINIKPGNKPRIMYRDLKKDKISEIIVSSKKQFLLAEIEELSYQLNYYSENNLYIMDYNIYEEIIYDGSSLGDKLSALKAEFDSGKSIELKIQKIGTSSFLTGYNVVKEQLPEVSEPQKPKSLENQKELKKEKKISKSETLSKKPPESQKQKNKASAEEKQKNHKKEESKANMVEKTPKIKDKTLNYKEFKGLGEKTFNILVNEYKITSLLGLINAKTDELKKIPKVSEKKINDWKNQAKKLLEV